MAEVAQKFQNSSTEEEFSLPTNDGFKIYGRINRAEQIAKKAVVLCHGLTGHIYEHHFQEAKRYFTERGYDVIRFGFYSEEKDARRIDGCTVSLHAKDLDVVLSHFKDKYDGLYVAGHSYGGLTILVGNPQAVKANALWDGTFVEYGEEDIEWNKYWVLNKELNTCIIDWPPVPFIVGMPMYEEKNTFTTEKLDEWGRAVSKPTIVLAAGASNENLPNQERLYKTLQCEKEYYAIPGAGHCFNEGDTVFELLEKTYDWFERF